MAFSTTVLQAAILKTQEISGFRYQDNEVRGSQYGALEVFVAETPRLVPETTLKAIKEASSQVTSIDVFQKEALGTGTARACSGTGTGTTVNVPLTYSTISEQFQLSFLQHQGNRAKYAEAFAHLFNQRMQSIWTRLDTEVVTYLDANKVLSANNDGSIIAQVANAGQVPNADKDQFFNKIKAEMEENDHYGGLINIASTSQRELIRFDQAQGGANGTNLQFQMNDFSHHTTNRIVNGGGIRSTSYVVVTGTVGIIPWINGLHKDGRKEGQHEWTTFADPSGMLGAIELKIKTDCVDNSGTLGVGHEADLVESFVMSFEYAIISAYDSAKGSAIFKYEQTVA